TPRPGIGTLGTYNGWAYAPPSRVRVNSFPNWFTLTFAVFSTRSSSVALVLRVSYWAVGTDGWAGSTAAGIRIRIAGKRPVRIGFILLRRAIRSPIMSLDQP